MAKGTVAKDATEVAWLLFGTLGVVILTLVVHTAYKDIQNFFKTARAFFKPRKERKQKQNIMRLLGRYSHEDLAKIVFSLAAWPREGIPDKGLYVARPPHYCRDLKSGSGQRNNGYSDPTLSMDYLTRNTRENLLVLLDVRLDNRSRLTLTWLEQWLASVDHLKDDENQAQNWR